MFEFAQIQPSALEKAFIRRLVSNSSVSLFLAVTCDGQIGLTLAGLVTCIRNCNVCTVAGLLVNQ